MKKDTLNLKEVFKTQRAFAKARQWEKFHTPKNIATALSIEAAELLEVFLWLNEKESKAVMKSPKMNEAVRHEMADVFYWLCRLADILEVDLEGAFWEKMEQNAKKYPVALARGNARKYTEFRLSKKNK